MNREFSVVIEKDEEDGYFVASPGEAFMKLKRILTVLFANGQVQELPRATLGHPRQEDFIAPRVPVYGSSTYEFKPAIWIQDPTR